MLIQGLSGHHVNSHNAWHYYDTKNIVFTIITIVIISSCILGSYSGAQVVHSLHNLPLFAGCFSGTSSRLSVMNLSPESSTKKLHVIMLFCQCGRGR